MPIMPIGLGWKSQKGRFSSGDLDLLSRIIFKEKFQ
jgi:hypothetical protein